MTDDSPSDTFIPEDDGPHPATGDFYETETFWYSFFVPERGIGGWLYTSLRATAGVCAGGAWIWDGRRLNRGGPRFSNSSLGSSIRHRRVAPNGWPSPREPRLTFGSH